MQHISATQWCKTLVQYTCITQWCNSLVQLIGATECTGALVQHTGATHWSMHKAQLVILCQPNCQNQTWNEDEQMIEATVQKRDLFSEVGII